VATQAATEATRAIDAEGEAALLKQSAETADADGRAPGGAHPSSGSSPPKMGKENSEAQQGKSDSGTSCSRSSGRGSTRKTWSKLGSKIFGDGEGRRPGGRTSVMKVLSPLRRSKEKEKKTTEGAPERVKVKTSNQNAPTDYVWLEEVLGKISGNTAHTLGITDTATGKDFVPVFFVIGSCPNMFCGMQVVVYCANADCEVDVWWVKPQQTSKKAGATCVETKTLSRNAKGPHKNDPGRSKPFYKPLADLFQEGVCKDGRRFGIEAGKDGQAPRAYIEESNGVNERWYMYLVWQEDWTANPLARNKFIKGRVAYQKKREERVFFTRQFEMQSSGQLVLAELEDQVFETVLPDETIKDLFE